MSSSPRELGIDSVIEAKELKGALETQHRTLYQFDLRVSGGDSASVRRVAGLFSQLRSENELARRQMRLPRRLYAAGFPAFLDLNRCVRKGEKAIRILGPVTVKQRDANGEETGEKKVFFRTVPVFDVSMTDPLPGKERQPRITGAFCVPGGVISQAV
jgi:hypothetical protein